MASHYELLSTYMKKYKFTAERIIEAESEEEAIEIFASNSFDFATEAECEEVEE